MDPNSIVEAKADAEHSKKSSAEDKNLDAIMLVEIKATLWGLI